MYLAELKLWNFRKYGINGSSFENSSPGLSVNFHDGVNVLVGENDSGKTSIIDAIRYVLRTQSLEYIQIDEKDFHKTDANIRVGELKIECTFKGFSDDGSEAAHFLEWIGFDENNDYVLKIWLYAKINDDNSIYQSIRAGIDSEGSYIEGDARNLLRVIYLKPLRDALSEMTQGNKSRLAQILKGLKVFRKEKGIKHSLENEYDKAKEKIDNYFKIEQGKSVLETINNLLNKDFFVGTEAERNDKKAIISLAENELSEILRQLNLILEDNKSGLGSLNLLCIAAELLYLNENKPGLKLTLIEELEAHLHPQYQLRLIDFIQNYNKGQFILTTHSTTLASKIELENLLICRKNHVFPMGKDYTQLESGDYKFLQRFLDATKANLFFAKGVILVEGDAENLLIPTIADLIDRPLHRYGVSIVNVGSTAFNRYRKIFLRKDEPLSDWLDINVSIITDLDVPSIEYWEEQKDEKRIVYFDEELINKFKEITPDINWEHLKDEIVKTKTAFEDIYKANKIVKTKKLENGVHEKLIELFLSNTKETNSSTIDILRISRRQKLETSLKSQNLRGFIPFKWTLEYDIACSKLYKYLAIAIKLAKLLKANNNIGINDELIKEFDNDVEIELKDKANNEKTAYEIFKPLNDGTVSKATTSQCLAEILLYHKSEILEVIKTDPLLTYLRDAIYYVTELPK